MTRWLSFSLLTLLSGCSIVMSSKLPIDRPPEELTAGVSMAYVDHRFGYPIACGLDSGGNYAEQIQFIDGIPIGWKVARFCTHGVLDAATYFLWEFIGTPLELYYSDYPTYVYYVIYDSDGKIVRAVDAQTPEGREYSKLQWTLPFVDELKVNKDASVRNRYWENR